MQKVYLQTAKEALRNSRLWLNEANSLLFEKKSYGHSCALSIFSLEEAMKSMICLFVGMGIMEPRDELSKGVFKDHHSKVEMAALVSILSQLQLAASAEIDADIQKEMSDFFVQIGPILDEVTNRMVDLRMKGMYVDLDQAVTSSPNDFCPDRAEGIFMIAFQYHKFIEQIIRRYDVATEEERKRIVATSKALAKQLRKNLKKIQDRT